MDIVTLLREAETAGLQVRADGDRLVVRGPRALEPLAKRLLERKADVLSVLVRKETTNGSNAAASDVVPGPGVQPVAEPARSLDPEVAWRIEAMRPQVPNRGPIPFLLARPEIGPQPDCCLSCGDPLPETGRYRCGPCQRAAEIALNAAREGVI